MNVPYVHKEKENSKTYFLPFCIVSRAFFLGCCGPPQVFIVWCVYKLEHGAYTLGKKADIALLHAFTISKSNNILHFERLLRKREQLVGKQHLPISPPEAYLNDIITEITLKTYINQGV